MRDLYTSFVAAVCGLVEWLKHPKWWPGTLWRWGRVLWVCRIPLVSSLGGGLLLSATPQARDCFSDLGLSPSQWGVFFVLTFLWAWTVHIAARRAVLADDWVPDARCGELSDARREELRAEYEWPALLVPRLLGLMVFVFVLIALVRARANLVTAEDVLVEAHDAVVLSWWLEGATILAGLVYILVIWTRRHFRSAIMGSHVLQPLEPALLMGVRPFPLSMFANPRAPKLSPILSTIDIVTVLFGVGVTFFFAIAFVFPHWVADLLPRVMIVALLFGGVVLMLGEVALWSTRLQTPFLLILMVLVAVCLYVVEAFHDIRYFEASAPPSKARGAEPQVHLTEAVRRWKAANGCEAQGQTCPRPILIAGAGGASRAAFMTATVVGAIIDLGLAEPEKYGNVRNRIFAMSTVSGSSLGAVVMRAALTDAADNGTPDNPPCTKTTNQRAWFRNRNAEEVRKARHGSSWRDCFQLLLAGDFLSPVMIGLFYRDNFPLADPVNQRPLWADRATLLEQAFERRYAEVVTGDEAACGATADKGLCRPLGWHPDPATAGAWLPLLFINGTSVTTGRRIIASDVPMGDQTPSGPLLPFAYDVREYRQGATAAAGGSDIRLSTAATISARFPVISPQGNLRAPDGNRIDEVVDGGYFENDGLATIADVAAALAQYGLDPFVIRIVNEPSETKMTAPQVNTGRPNRPDIEDRSWFDDVSSILRTLISTRTGHLDGHEAYLKSVLKNEARLFPIGVFPLERPNPDNPLCRWDVRNSAKFDLRSMKNVSMSWWMSHPVQAYLDAQLCVPVNWRKLVCELRVGRTGAECES